MRDSRQPYTRVYYMYTHEYQMWVHVDSWNVETCEAHRLTHIRIS